MANNALVPMIDRIQMWMRWHFFGIIKKNKFKNARLDQCLGLKHGTCNSSSIVIVVECFSLNWTHTHTMMMAKTSKRIKPNQTKPNQFCCWLYYGSIIGLILMVVDTECATLSACNDRLRWVNGTFIIGGWGRTIAKESVTRGQLMRPPQFSAPRRNLLGPKMVATDRQHLK